MPYQKTIIPINQLTPANYMFQVGPELKDSNTISKEEEFLKEFKTLIREFALIIFNTTQSNAEARRAKNLLESMEQLDDPANQAQDAGYF
jgi:hypothetical protein